MPKTYLGQHFLTNDTILEQIAGFVPPKSKILEIGAGEGQLTRELVKNAESVEAIEIDPDLLPQLTSVARKNNKIKIVIKNALELDFASYSDFWIVGNIPYHITEPLFMKLADTKFKGGVFMVGDSFAREAVAIPNQMESFGKLSWIIFTFFKAEIKFDVDKENFDPKPRTDSGVLALSPRNEEEYTDPTLYLMRWLFRGGKDNKLIKNALMEGDIRLKKTTKNLAREMIAKTGLTGSLLAKPFEQLNNDEYLKLYRAFLKIACPQTLPPQTA